MSIQQPPSVSGYRPAPVPGTAPHRGHGRMLRMLLMCATMLLFLGVLVLTGRAIAGSVFGALLCVGMMAAMMGMHGGHDRR